MSSKENDAIKFGFDTTNAKLEEMNTNLFVIKLLYYKAKCFLKIEDNCLCQQTNTNSGTYENIQYYGSNLRNFRFITNQFVIIGLQFVLVNICVLILLIIKIHFSILQKNRNKI